ncbi:MAG TPA: MBL fold metallo-hydrolase [Xanthobacteraceae bacterium]|nr:MBL fold metallo-hydrolase [Xanthobacteraceae bacterium]
MKSAWLLSAGLALAPIAIGVSAQTMDFGKIEIITDQLAPNLYALSGSSGVDPSHDDAAGGRIGVLVGPDGILMVDAQYAQLTGKVVTAIRKISAAPIRFLVNTHIHRDHTAGNANFARMGAVIFGREELRDGMVKISKSPNAAANPLSDPAGFPVVTYGMGPPVKIHIDGESVDLVPVRAAHTGGDTMIRFENADVIFIGDFYRNYGYPFIDIANGGSLKGMLEALDVTMKLAGPDTRLVPGHGTIIKRDDIVPYRDRLSAIAGKVRELVAQGKTLDEVQAAKVTAAYDAKLAGGTSVSSERFVAELYQELKGQ